MKGKGKHIQETDVTLNTGKDKECQDQGRQPRVSTRHNTLQFTLFFGDFYLNNIIYKQIL